MKKHLLSLSFLLFSSLIFAQSPIAKGESQINAGVGLSSWGVPLYFGLDYGVHPDITIGGELSYRSYNDKYANVSYDHSVIGISGNGNYHFNRILEIPKKWDFYAGLNLGFYIWNSRQLCRITATGSLCSPIRKTGLPWPFSGYFYIQKSRRPVWTP